MLAANRNIVLLLQLLRVDLLHILPDEVFDRLGFRKAFIEHGDQDLKVVVVFKYAHEFPVGISFG